MGGRVLQGSLWRAAVVLDGMCLFLFTRDLAAGKRILQSQFGDVLNVGAERSCLPGTYEPVKKEA